MRSGWVFVLVPAILMQFVTSDQQVYTVNSLHNSLSKSVGMNQSINHFFNEYRKERQNAGGWWCDDELGCLDITSEWVHSVIRPFNFLPWTRDRIQTMFTLYTRDGPTAGTWLSAGAIKRIAASTFRSSRPTKILVHGFNNSGREKNWLLMIKNLLAHGDYNVIQTHWGRGASSIYQQSALNTRVVGLEIAYLANTLISDFGLNPDDLHLIGHSMGAHVCAYAANGIPGVGRITGLDPAGHYFAGMAPIVRLDPSDAKFVDVIHTEIGPGLTNGVTPTHDFGHLDFYANGGRPQPGCGVRSSVPEIWDYIPHSVWIHICSHMRAMDLFTESLVSKCPFVGYECNDYDSFIQGKCYTCGSDGTNCAVFGMDSIRYPAPWRTNIKMFFNTGDTTPFCRYHYAVQARITSARANREVNGNFALAIKGESAAFESTPLYRKPNWAQQVYDCLYSSDRSSTSPFDDGKVQHFMLMSEVDVGKVEKVVLKWQRSSRFPVGLSSVCLWSWTNVLLVSDVAVSHLTIADIHDMKDRALDNTYKTCPSSGRPGAFLKLGSSADFSTC